MLPTARLYREQGWSVIPVRGKQPLVSWKDYQTRQATDDELTGWWATWPEAGVGVVTGAISGLVVLDVDGKVDDPATWVYDAGLTPTLTAQTPRGGLHLYYGHPGVPTQNTAHTFEKRGLPCDIRGDGGFVVAPPSPGYTFLRHWHGIVPWVDPRVGVVGETRGLEAIGDLASTEALFAPASEGGRNQHAAKLAGYLLKTCVDEAAAWVQLRQWNRQNVPPLDERELSTTFNSIAKRERLKPRSLSMNVPDSRTSNEPAEPDWLEGAAWADKARNEPKRDGQVLRTLPLCGLHKGFCPGDLITVAARAGVGKTTLVSQMFWEAGVELGESGMFFSGDMSEAEVLQFMTIARVGRLHYSPEDWHESLRLLSNSKLAIKASGYIVTDRIAQVLEQRPGTRYVVIDHFNKVRTESATRATDLKRAAIEIKSLGRQYGVTFIVISQLNRLADNVEHLLPSHLAESDALIQESDVVYGISYVGDRTQQSGSYATIRVALLKNRFGPEFVEQIAWFHKAEKRFQWHDRAQDWSGVR